MLLQLGIILEPSKCNFDAVFNDSEFNAAFLADVSLGK